MACPLPHDDVIDRPRMTILRLSRVSGSRVEDSLDLFSAFIICVFSQYPTPCRFSNGLRTIGIQALQEFGDFHSIPSNQYLSSRIEKNLISLPRIRDRARAGAGRFENTRGRREAVPGHAFAADVQHRAGR